MTAETRCKWCDEVIDSDTCWCGDYIVHHTGWDGHFPVPMGCICHMNKKDKVNEKFD